MVRQPTTAAQAANRSSGVVPPLQYRHPTGVVEGQTDMSARRGIVVANLDSGMLPVIIGLHIVCLANAFRRKWLGRFVLCYRMPERVWELSLGFIGELGWWIELRPPKAL